MKTTASTRDVARSQAQRFAALKREILHLDYFCKGTVLKRMMKCGNPQCPCHRDPSKRHGPYWECTYKVQNKTINLKLYPETNASLSGCHPPTSQVHVASGPHGTAVAIGACALGSTEVDRHRMKEKPRLFA